MQKLILVIRQDRIGDVVLATGLPREIKNVNAGPIVRRVPVQ